MTDTEFALITLDGLSKPIYDDWIAPHMDHDIDVSICESTLPPATTPATYSLQTGVDASYHSVYGYFSRAHPGDDPLPSGIAEGAKPIATPTFFEALDANDVTTLISWVPNSWPATDYRLASSWVLGGLQGSNHGDRQLSTNPARLAEQVGATFGATMQEEGMRYAKDSERALTRAMDRLEARKDATLWAADRISPEFVMMYCFPTDHYLHWHYPEANHDLLDPDVELFERGMRHAATVVDEVIRELDPDEVAICSDHGFRNYERKACVNARLLEAGHLVAGTDTDGALNPDRQFVPHGIDRTESVAVCRKDKVWVDEGSEDAVRETLESWVDPATDDTIIAELIEPDWQGPFAPAGPDFVILPNEGGVGYDFYYPGLQFDVTFGDSVGAHSRRAIVGGAIDASRIHDIPHAICEYFGVDLWDAHASLSVERTDVDASASELNQAALENRLEDLGYL